jgi:hypothetical protein
MVEGIVLPSISSLLAAWHSIAISTSSCSRFNTAVPSCYISWVKGYSGSALLHTGSNEKYINLCYNIYMIS